VKYLLCGRSLDGTVGGGVDGFVCSFCLRVYFELSFSLVSFCLLWLLFVFFFFFLQAVVFSLCGMARVGILLMPGTYSVNAAEAKYL
jgi:hypothetical protein